MLPESIWKAMMKINRYNQQVAKLQRISASKTFEFEGEYGGKYEVVLETGTGEIPRSKRPYKFLSIEVFYELDVIGRHSFFSTIYRDYEADALATMFHIDTLCESLDEEGLTELTDLILEHRDEIIEWLLENVDHSLLEFDHESAEREAMWQEKANRIYTAYYLAGRSVMCCLLGVPIEHMTIEPQGQFTFITDQEILKRLPADSERLKRYVFVFHAGFLAGPIAERMFSDWENDEIDLQEVMSMRRYKDEFQILLEPAVNNVVDHAQVKTYIVKAFDYTKSMLSQHWNAVKAVADLLLERNQIDGQEVKRTVEQIIGGTVALPVIPE